MAISLVAVGAVTAAVPAQTPRPLPSSNFGPRVGPPTMYYQKDSSPPTTNAQPTSYQEAQPPEAGGTTLPPSVLEVIKRATQATVPAKELFALRSEAQIDREIIAESGPESIYSQFPKDYHRVTIAFAGRSFEPRVKYVEPNFVCHRRLYFEEKNAERYGWELGPLQPVFSTLYYLKDVALLPYHFATRPCDRFECSAGKCLPGDPTPYLLYPVEFSVTGGLFEAGAIIGLAAIFP